MNTDVLDQAEARLIPAATTAQTLRQERIDAMREEIGYKQLEQAKLELPKLEGFIGKEIQPFLNRVAAIAARSHSPLPQQVQVWLQEMATLIESVPRTLRAGISGWEKLTPPLASDGRSLDPNERARLIYQIRVCLRNYDGAKEQLAHLKGLTEQFITERNWPASPPPVAA